MTADLFSYIPPARNYRRTDVVTSREAGEHAHRFIPEHYAEILTVMRQAGRPLAAEQIADAMGVDHVAINRRLPELVRLAAIERTAERHVNRSGRGAFRYRVKS